MIFKEGVSFEHADWRLWPAALKVEECYRKYLPGYELCITSINDGKHGKPGRPSLHYPRKGPNGQILRPARAFDTRVWHIAVDTQKELEKDIQAALGIDWDVVLHELPEVPHFHIEYDPPKATYE